MYTQTKRPWLVLTALGVVLGGTSVVTASPDKTLKRRLAEARRELADLQRHAEELVTKALAIKESIEQEQATIAKLQALLKKFKRDDLIGALNDAKHRLATFERQFERVMKEFSMVVARMRLVERMIAELEVRLRAKDGDG